MCAYNVSRIFKRLIKKDVMLTNPCFYVFGDAFRVYIFTVHIFKPYSHLTKFWHHWFIDGLFYLSY